MLNYFSLGVSVKMNILLFAPGLLVLLLKRNGLIKTIYLLIVCALIQVRQWWTCASRSLQSLCNHVGCMYKLVYF